MLQASVHQTLMNMRSERIESFLKNLVFGPSRRGERIFDKTVKFNSTYPKGYNVKHRRDPESFNRWISQDVHNRMK